MSARKAKGSVFDGVSLERVRQEGECFKHEHLLWALGSLVPET